MRARRIDDPREWLDAATPFLVGDEARHNLILGLGDILVSHPDWYTAWDLWLVEDGRDVTGASLQTAPHNLALARPAAPDVIPTLADAILAFGTRLPGVTAALPEAERFADVWTRRAGGSWRRAMAQGIYALEAVRRVPRPQGRMRAATREDRDLLLAWVRAFSQEANPHRPMTEIQLTRTVDERLAPDDPLAGYAIWDAPAGTPASISGYGGRTPNGVRVGPVYTPPELRGRGFATALVADLSAHLLAAGRRSCFLYTDLANPTSNAIYARIGYEQVCGSAEIAFDGA